MTVGRHPILGDAVRLSNMLFNEPEAVKMQKVAVFCTDGANNGAPMPLRSEAPIIMVSRSPNPMDMRRYNPAMVTTADAAFRIVKSTN